MMKVDTKMSVIFSVLAIILLGESILFSSAFSPLTNFRNLFRGGKNTLDYSNNFPKQLKIDSVSLKSQMDEDNTSDDYFEEDDFVATDFQLFLAQRTLQSFFFLLVQIRDPHTLSWLDKFLSPALSASKTGTLSEALPDNSNLPSDAPSSTDTGWGTSLDSDRKLTSSLLFYHGVDMFNTTVFPTWDSIFLELLAQPTTTIVVTPNFHIKDEFEIEMDPGRLCSRILSVRGQIVQEWTVDLQVIATMGQGIFSSYWDKVQKGETVANGVAFDRPNLLFLESSPDPESDLRPSPIRKGNFDVLLRLCTQESICRILRRKEGLFIDSEDDVQKQMANQAFLKQFYVERLYKYFKGNIIKYGRAHDFLEELMLSPPILINDNSETPCMVDPLGIAEVICRERDRVAAEWRQLLIENISKGIDEVEIQKTMLNRMMGVRSGELRSDNNIEASDFQ